jgi:hypothetical protein
MCEDLAHKKKNIGIRSANPLTLANSFWLLLRRPLTIGPMSAIQYKQIGFRRGATSFKMKTVFIKQNGNF